MSEAEKLEIAIGALADIAFSEDMTLEIARSKAARIYEELRKEELEEEAAELRGEEAGEQP